MRPIVFVPACLIFLATSVASPAGEAVGWRYREGAFDLSAHVFRHYSNGTRILTSDGELRLVDASFLEPSDDPFEPLSVQEVESALRREFASYEVRRTQHFLIVQPRGRGNHWAWLFERVHRGAGDLCRRCGIEMREGAFPMVAVIAATRRGCRDMLRRRGETLGPEAAGYYFLTNNRVYTFDVDAGDTGTLAVLRHEAAHQIAYNFGLHDRIDHPGRGISEGFGSLFESPGMTDNRRSATRVDRATPRYLNRVRRWTEEHLSHMVDAVIADPAVFDDPKFSGDAYSAAWLIAFYLSERAPKAYGRLLNGSCRGADPWNATETRRRQSFERWTGRTTGQAAREMIQFLERL